MLWRLMAVVGMAWITGTQEMGLSCPMHHKICLTFHNLFSIRELCSMIYGGRFIGY